MTLLQQSISYLSVVLILASNLSCNPSSSEPAQKPYFDLTGFFDKEVQRLTADSMKITKTSKINEQVEQHKMNWVDWKKEFALFYSSEINKASLIGKYTSDTSTRLWNVDTLIITYTAINKDLRTRTLSVVFRVPGPLDSFHDPYVTRISIHNQTTGFLSTTNEVLNYLPQEGYVISSSTETKFVGLNNFAVRAEFEEKEAEGYFQ